MTETVEVAIPVDASIAPALENAGLREAMGHMISRALRPGRDTSELERIIAEIKREARANGLTDEDVVDELRIYNSERRGHPDA